MAHVLRSVLRFIFAPETGMGCYCVEYGVIPLLFLPPHITQHECAALSVLTGPGSLDLCNLSLLSTMCGRHNGEDSDEISQIGDMAPTDDQPHAHLGGWRRVYNKEFKKTQDKKAKTEWLTEKAAQRK